MSVILQIAALSLVFIALQYALRHAGKWVLMILFLLIPITFTHDWLRINDFDHFVWLKIYTIFFCVVGAVLLRFTTLGNRPWARYAIPLTLGANILEATSVDLLASGSAHLWNAIAGLLLIATIPWMSETLRIDTSTRCRDLQFGTSRGWVIGYTLWNWTFVYLNYPAYAGHHAAVLISAFAVGVIDPRLWTQARGCILGLNLLGMATFNIGMLDWLDTSNWIDDRVELFAAVLSLGFMARHAYGAASPFLRTHWIRLMEASSVLPAFATR